MAALDRRLLVGTILFIALAVHGCATSNLLGDFEFAETNLAATYDVPPAPDVLTGPCFDVWDDDPIQVLLRAGSRIATELQVEQVREKIDEASLRADAPGRLAERTLDRASRLLGAGAVQDVEDADYVFEVNVREYGIDAEGWDAAARFFVDADAFLLDGATGTEIWSARVSQQQVLTPQVIGQGRTTRDVISAAALATLSVEELTWALERLSDYCADEITGGLRDDLRRARQR